MQGKIIKGIAGFYYVQAENESQYECKAKGIFRKDHKKPLVGDEVTIEVLDEEEKKKSRENRRFGTRFVVDTSFSRLGSLQFDGYALAKDKRFDLIIRTERDIGSDFCANVMRLFKATLHEEGYAGTVKINVKEKFIKICDDSAESQTLADGIYI